MQTRNGFTLIEALVSLSILSIMLLLTLQLKNHLSFETFELKRLKLYIEETHQKAIENNKDVLVVFNGKSILLGNQNLSLNYCEIEPQSFHFLNNGTTEKSFTSLIHCENKTYELVVHLGSGHVVIR